MKIQLLSDLHIEGFANKHIYTNTSGADVLVLAGDINVGADKVYADLCKFAENFAHIVYVPGNHEWYHNSIDEFDDRLLTLLMDGPRNIDYLMDDAETIDGVTFIGTPLWTNFRGSCRAANEIGDRISDFRWYKPSECKRRAEQAQGYLTAAYETIPGKKVIVTHWIPAVEGISPRWAWEVELNKYFANDMGEWIKTLKDVPFWFFGHTHDSVDILLGDTRIIANPAGYRGRDGYYENRHFNPATVFEV